MSSERTCEGCRHYIPDENRCGAPGSPPDVDCFPTDSCLGWEEKGKNDRRTN